MVNVNDLVQRYRLSLRGIWNDCFWSVPERRDFDSVEVFRALKEPLFSALIARPLGLEERGRVFGPGFRVIPSEYATQGFPNLQVNRSVPSSVTSGIWEPIAGPFNTQESYFTLIDFFDWAPLRMLDFQYYVVTIDRLEGHQDCVGRHALIEVTYGDVVWDDSQHSISRV